MSWVGTAYHHQGGIKGAGVDCAFLLVRVYHACGITPDIDPRPYPPDWHFHRSEERYLGWVEKYCHRVDSPQPGDIALFKFARCVSHGAIVLDWPMIIHAHLGVGVETHDASRGRLASRLHAFYSPWK